MEELRKCIICDTEVEEIYRVYDFNIGCDINMCEMCYEVVAFYCSHHHRYETGTESYESTNGTICEEARDNYYCRCENCNILHENYCIHYIEDIDMLYCDECYDDFKSTKVIKDYHDNEDSYQDNKKSTLEDDFNNEQLYFGIELEVESGYSNADTNLMATELYNMNSDFVYEEDGSIINGFEIISYPFTFKYMEKTLAQELFKMLNALKRNKYEASERCGYHIHVSREGIRNEVDFVCLFEYFKDELFELSKRSEIRFNQWSKWYINSKNFIRNDVKYALDDCMSRYRAVNDDNYHTMEVRIFSGTLDFYELMARFELVYNFVQWANDHKINDKLTNIPDFVTVATYKSKRFIGEYLDKVLI